MVIIKQALLPAGTYADKSYQKPGYLPAEGTVELMNGVVTIFDAALEALPSFGVSGTVTDADTGDPIPGAIVRMASEELVFEATANDQGVYSWNIVFEGDYEISAGKWGYKTILMDPQTVDENNNAFTIQLEEGIEDIFMIDLGWTIAGTADQGLFELAIPPIGVTTPVGPIELTVQPEEDSPSDIGNGCYFTGNTADLQGGVLIGGSTRLLSPLFDGTQMEEPWLSFESWFLNVDPNGPSVGNDRIVVKVDNGLTVIILDLISIEDLLTPIDWTYSEHNLADRIEITDHMRILFEIFDNDY